MPIARNSETLKAGDPFPLPISFAKNGFSLHQIARDTNAAIYRQTRKGFSIEIEAFEVIRPVITTKAFIEGQWQSCPPREIYPSAEQWGERGWTYQDRERAYARFDKLRAA